MAGVCLQVNKQDMEMMKTFWYQLSCQENSYRIGRLCSSMDHKTCLDCNCEMLSKLLLLYVYISPLIHKHFKGSSYEY